MKKILLAFLLLANMLANGENNSNYKWVLNSDKSDEYDSWNTAKWGTSLWYSVSTDIAFNPANVSVANGYLKLKVKKESYNGKEYTCAAVKSTFGVGNNSIVEIRAKTIDYRANVTTALWLSDELLPSLNPNVEIDIMETLSAGSNPQKFTAGIHYWWAEGIGDQNLGWKDYFLPSGQNLSDQFHIYKLERYNGRVRFYFDGALFWDFDASTYTKVTDMERNVIFSIEGHAGTPIDAYLPNDFLIDYVRIYDYVDTTADIKTPLSDNNI